MQIARAKCVSRHKTLRVSTRIYVKDSRKPLLYFYEYRCIRFGALAARSRSPAGVKGTVKMAGNVEDLWKKGSEAARHPGRWDRIKHSPMARNNRKPGAVLANVTTMAVEAIPVPVLGAVVDLAMRQAIDYVKTQRSKRKLKSYGSGANLEKEVKHRIKALNVDELDRARMKVHSAIEELNKRLDSLRYLDHQPCDETFRLAKAFHYLDKRLELLEARSRVFEEVGARTQSWCEQIRGTLDQRKIKCDSKVNEIKEWGRRWPETHDDCSKSLCIR